MRDGRFRSHVVPMKWLFSRPRFSARSLRLTLSSSVLYSVKEVTNYEAKHQTDRRSKGHAPRDR